MSFYRNIVWFLKGIHEYTRSGYEQAAKHFVAKELDVAVVGRSFMITGANSGIGKATAMAIAKKGGTVHMVCRNKERAEKAKEDIVRETGNTINNAGCMVNKREVSDDGLEKNFATNTLGVYLLTQSLIPLLQKSRDPRVITVTSGGMLVQKLQHDDLQSAKGPFNGTMVYAQNKRQQVVLTEQWAKHHPAIHFSVMHPGWADTPAVSTSMPQFHQMMGERLRSAEQGADTVVWLSLSRTAGKRRSGKFFQDRRAVPAHLPLAWTHSSPEEVRSFMTQLDILAQAAKQPRTDTQPSFDPTY
ncbi:dehydrogenase/reductase SDR family member 12 isoform X2 [Coregonus clupeaformis]|uniref:dehydrogenase/reductase SDR family member 12 isoform X2 n=1 Tax=Coregonus clupeaformis TaxID=59861 RepID=UPI001BE01A52|nr:dehydrogenase/reductase SDR family member 12 isoform X2 [Coregonus clupeaformis]